MSSKKGSSGVRNIISSASLDPLGSYLGHLVTGKEKEWKHTTLGRMFQRPSTKFPETKKAGSAQAVADAASADAMMAAKEKERKRLRSAAGRSSLIKTSGRGVLEPVDTKRKRLLGE